MVGPGPLPPLQTSPAGLEPWVGNGWSVEVLFSEAGLSTTILVHRHSDGGWLLLDCGPGVTRDLIDRQVWLPSLLGVVLTHGHADHMGGLFALLSLLRLSGRRPPLPLFYPTDCREVDATVQLVRSVYGGSLPFVIEEHVLDPGARCTIGGITIDAIAALHRGTRVAEDGRTTEGVRLNALSLSLRHGGQKVVYGGDSAPHDGLRAIVAGADLALLEATFPTAVPHAFEVHSTLPEAHALAATAKDSRLIHRIERPRPW